MLRTLIVTALLAFANSAYATDLKTANGFVEGEKFVAGLTDDRIIDQVISTVGGTAELPFLLYEDVEFDFTGICPEKCTFTFEARDGLLMLTGVEVADKDTYKVAYNYKMVVDGAPAGFNAKLRAEIIENPRALVKRPPTS